MWDNIVQVISGHRPVHRFGPGEAAPTLVFPGSFNPLHVGHRKMAAIASERFHQPVHYEISVLNVDKPPLTPEEAAARISQFDSDAIVWLTRTATFLEKAQTFPAATFIVGVDTAMRLLDLRYYHDATARDHAIARLLEKQCRFLVFGRLIDGSFAAASSLSPPAGVAELFVSVPTHEFREDISSTELRGKSASG